jgi:hypothetical protein
VRASVAACSIWCGTRLRRHPHEYGRLHRRDRLSQRRRDCREDGPLRLPAYERVVLAISRDALCEGQQVGASRSARRSDEWRPRTAGGTEPGAGRTDKAGLAPLQKRRPASAPRAERDQQAHRTNGNRERDGRACRDRRRRHHPRRSEPPASTEAPVRWRCGNEAIRPSSRFCRLGVSVLLEGRQMCCGFSRETLQRGETRVQAPVNHGLRPTRAIRAPWYGMVWYGAPSTPVSVFRSLRVVASFSTFPTREASGRPVNQRLFEDWFACADGGGCTSCCMPTQPKASGWRCDAPVTRTPVERAVPKWIEDISSRTYGARDKVAAVRPASTSVAGVASAGRRAPWGADAAAARGR